MKHDGHYRFSLQFKNDTPDSMMVGDFLCGIGYKKSRFIVEIVAQYLKAHPELSDRTVRHEIAISEPPAGKLYQQLRDEMKAYIDEKLSEISAAQSGSNVLIEEMSEGLEDMLAGLDAFDEI